MRLCDGLLPVLILAAMLPVAALGDTGIVNREEELPQGLAIVPWKKTPADALEEGPVRLVEEPLQTIDPEVFRRRLGLKPDAGSTDTQP